MAMNEADVSTYPVAVFMFITAPEVDDGTLAVAATGRHSQRSKSDAKISPV
jgi:hypothetical protein